VSVVSSDDNTCVADQVTQTADSSGQEESQETDILNVDDLPEDNVEGDSSALIAEQRADPSLALGWKAVEAERSDFEIHRVVLCCVDVVPGVVKEVRSANSYLMDLGDSGTRHIHTNKIGHFVARVNGCAVVNDADNEFGCVVTPANVNVSVCPSARIDGAKLEHLDPQQRQLLTLLDEFADRFRDKPGLCDTQCTAPG